jgi:hypothetical protein
MSHLSRSAEKMRTALIPLLILLAACRPHEELPIQTDLKSLSAEPERYSGKRVEVEGVLAIGFEAMVFEDPAGPGPEPIWFGYEDFPSHEQRERGFDLLLGAIEGFALNGERTMVRVARVRVVGTFMHSRDGGYGHAAGYRSTLIIERILRAEPIIKEPNQSSQTTPRGFAPRRV